MLTHTKKAILHAIIFALLAVLMACAQEPEPPPDLAPVIFPDSTPEPTATPPEPPPTLAPEPTATPPKLTTEPTPTQTAVTPAQTLETTPEQRQPSTEDISRMALDALNHVRATHGLTPTRRDTKDATAQRLADQAIQQGWASHRDEKGIDPHLHDILSPGPALPENTLIISHPAVTAGTTTLWPNGIPLEQATWGGLHHNEDAQFWATGGPTGDWWSTSVGYATDTTGNAYTVIRLFNERGALDINIQHETPSWFSIVGNIRDAGPGARIAVAVARRNVPTRSLTEDERRSDNTYSYGEASWIAHGSGIAQPDMLWRGPCLETLAPQSPDRKSGNQHCAQGPALLHHGILHPVEWNTEVAPAAGPPGALGIFLEMAPIDHEPSPGLYTVVVEYSDDENPAPEVVAALPIMVDVMGPRLYRTSRNDSQVEIQWDHPTQLPPQEPHLWEVQWTRSWDNQPQVLDANVTWGSHEPADTISRTISGLRRTWDYQVRVRGKSRGNYYLGWSEWIHIPRVTPVAVSSGPTNADETEPNWLTYTSIKHSLMTTINNARRQRGLTTLKRMSDLASQGHAENMAGNCYLSPWNSDGTKPHTRQALTGNYHWSQQLTYGFGWCPEKELAPEAGPQNPTDELTLAITRRINAPLPSQSREYADLTAPGQRPHPPKITSVQPVEDGFTLSWNQSSGPPATRWQYLVTPAAAQPDPNGWRSIPQYAADTMQHRIRGLTPGTDYTVTMQSINTAGTSGSSNAVTTSLPIRQQQSIRLQARMYGDGRLAIKWHHPVADQDENLRYQFRYRPLGGAYSSWANAFLTEDNETIVAHGLHPDVDYAVEMRAVSASAQKTALYRIKFTNATGQSTQWHTVPLNDQERTALAQRARLERDSANDNVNHYEIRVRLPKGSQTAWIPVNLTEKEHTLFTQNRRQPGQYRISINPTHDGTQNLRIHFPDGNQSSTKNVSLESLLASDYQANQRYVAEIRPIDQPTSRERLTTLLNIEHAPEYHFDIRLETRDGVLTTWKRIILTQYDDIAYHQNRGTPKDYRAVLTTQDVNPHTVTIVFPDGRTSQPVSLRITEEETERIRKDRVAAEVRKAETQPYHLRLKIAGFQRSEIKTIHLEAEEEGTVAQLLDHAEPHELEERTSYQYLNVQNTERVSNTARVKAGTPARLTGLTARATEGGVQLEWKDPADYRITGWQYRQRSTDAQWGNWTATPNLELGFTTPELRRGLEYSFQVRAIWNDRASEASVTATALFPTAPSLPVKLSITPTGAHPTLHWTTSTREFIDGWQFQIRNDNGQQSAWTEIQGGANVRSHIMSGYWLNTEPRVWQPGIPTGSTYRISVRPTAASQAGPASNDVEFQRPRPPSDTIHTELEAISNTVSRQWQEVLLSPDATHVALGVAQNPTGQTWLTIDVASRSIRLSQPPEIVEGRLTIDGLVTDGRRVFNPDDIRVEITWDLGPWRLEPSQLARTANYDIGQPTGIILPQLTAYQDVDFVALPDPEINENSTQPCVRQSRAQACLAYQRPYSPYEAVRDEPPRSAQETAELRAEAWKQYLRDNRLVPVYHSQAQIWETQGRRFRIEANVRNMLEHYQDGTYTVVIALRNPTTLRWDIAATYPTFHGQEPTIPIQWGTGYLPDRTIGELTATTTQSTGGTTVNFQINALQGWNELRLEQPQVAELIASQGWLRDWISLEEKRAAEALVLIAQAETRQTGQSILLERLLDDIMLANGVTPHDTTALRSIYAVAFLQEQYGLVNEILNRPGFREGLAENDVKALTILPSIALNASAGSTQATAILDWYRSGTYEGQQRRPFDLQERVIRTPLAGEITLGLFRTEKGSVQLMDTIADSIRIIERIMAQPMPVRYVAILVHDDQASGQFQKDPAIGRHYGTHFTVHPDYDRAHWQGHDNAGLQVSGLTSRYYWTRNDQDQLNLIRDGANELISYLAEQERSNRKLWPAYPPCVWEQNLSSIRNMEHELDQIEIEACQYSLMARLFLELTETTGQEQMLERLRSISKRLKNTANTTGRDARIELERYFPENHNLSVIHKWWEGATKLGIPPSEQAPSSVATLPNAYGDLHLRATPGCLDPTEITPPGAPGAPSTQQQEEFDPRVCVHVEYHRRAANAQPVEVTMTFHYEDGYQYLEETKVMHYARTAQDEGAATWEVELPNAAQGNHWVQLSLHGEVIATAHFYNPGPVDPNPDP